MKTFDQFNPLQQHLIKAKALLLCDADSSLYHSCEINGCCDDSGKFRCGWLEKAIIELSKVDEGMR